jgi:hypothetical protein
MKFIFALALITLWCISSQAASGSSLGSEFIVEFVSQRKPYQDKVLNALAETFEHREDEDEMFAAHIKFISKLVASNEITAQVGRECLVPSVLAFCQSTKNKEGERNETPSQQEACVKTIFSNLGASSEVISNVLKAASGEWSKDHSKSAYYKYRQLLDDALKEECTPKRALKTYLRILVVFRDHFLIPEKLDWNKNDRAMDTAKVAFEGVVEKTISQIEKDRIFGNVTPITKSFIQNVKEEREYFELVQNKAKDMKSVKDVANFLDPGYLDTIKNMLN